MFNADTATTTHLPCPELCSNTARMNWLFGEPFYQTEVALDCSECSACVLEHQGARTFVMLSELFADGLADKAQLTEYLEGYGYFKRP